MAWQVCFGRLFICPYQFGGGLAGAATCGLLNRKTIDIVSLQTCHPQISQTTWWSCSNNLCNNADDLNTTDHLSFIICVNNLPYSL